MASMGMLGAGLSAMGDTLGKYAMQRISSDEALAREKSLADYKIEMAEKADARAAESYAKKVGGARTAAATALQGRIAEQTRLPGLLSLQSQSEAAWKDNPPASAPVLRSGEVTEETALRDLSAKDRDIYRRNVAENIEYAQGLKPSTSQVEAETLRVLMDSSPKEAKQYLEMLNTKSEIEKRLRGETGKFEFRTVGKELVAIHPTTGETTVIHRDKSAGTGAKPLTAAQTTTNDEIDLARKQVRLWNEGGRTDKEIAESSADAKILTKARERKTGSDPDYDIYKKNLGKEKTQGELAAERDAAGRKPDPKAVVNPSAVPSLRDQYNAAVDRAQQIPDKAKRAEALRDLESAARKQGLFK